MAPPARLAVLGLLIEQPAHRYDVVRRLRARIGSVWDIKNAQVYHDVKVLEQEGFVERVDDEAGGAPLEPAGGGRRSWIYQPTRRGRETFESWMSIDSPEDVQPIRNSLAMRLAFLRPERVPALLKFVGRREHVVLTRIRDTSETCPELDQSSALLDYEAVGAQLILEGSIGALQAELRWLRRVRNTLEAMIGQPDMDRP